jgi:hypothetical protein
VQAILQGARIPRGGVYAVPPRPQPQAFNAVGPPPQAYGAPLPAAAAAYQHGQPAGVAQSTNLWIGFEAMPEFNLVEQLRGPGADLLCLLQLSKAGKQVAA